MIQCLRQFLTKLQIQKKLEITMKDRLLEILEKYEPRSGDEEKFINKHTVVAMEGPGYAEIRAAVENSSFADRKGYTPGEDEEVYEQHAADITQAVEDFLEEASALEELFATEEGYDELVAAIFESDDDDEDDDDEDDDEDDDDEDDDDEVEIETNPKVKKESKKKAKSGY